MRIYYDITIKDVARNCSYSYWAVSFSFDENRVLRVRTSDDEDISVKIDPNYRFFVHDVLTPDEFDECKTFSIPDSPDQEASAERLSYIIFRKEHFYDTFLQWYSRIRKIITRRQ